MSARTSHPGALSGFADSMRSLLDRLANDDGQAMTEYAITSFALIAGAGVSLLVFLPNAIAAYKTYILGFYIILGLPFP